MEKLFICSDVHGDYKSFKTFIEKAKNHPIIICGDLTPYSQSFSYLFSTINNDIYLVKGNCDNSYDFSIADIPIPPRIRVEYFFDRTFVITHGDLIRNPSESNITLYNNDFFISGHTHIARLFIDNQGIINLNPGSLSRPRGPFDASYAIIESNKAQIKTLSNDKTIIKINY